MKYSARRLLSLLLVIVMCVSAFPVNVFAWSSKSHANSANIIMLEAQRSDKANNNKGADVTVYAPYDDHVNGGYTYDIPDEYWEAITEYPEAFRAGSLGPDFYPDIVIGQMYIHPYDPSVKVGSGEWLTLLCDSVNRLPKDNPVRKEALAFTLGCMLHYCGDLFGHDFINTFSGGSYPSLFDVKYLDPTDKKLNNVLSHMSSEAYMDSLVNWDFYNKNKLLGIDAPERFIADTLVMNGSANGGAALLFSAYEELPPHFDYLISWRTELYNEANEWRDNMDPFSALCTAYLDAWIEDQDRAIYALVETFDRIAARLVEEKDPSIIDIATEELKAWGYAYGVYVTGIPDIMVDGTIISVEILTAIEEAIDVFDIDFCPLDELIEQAIIDAVLAYIGFPDIEKALNDYKTRLEDPSVQLDHENNPYMKNEDNFAEFKNYMDIYAAEQKLLSKTTASAMINGTDGGILDEVVDSDFEAFYNTMAMFKLVLMGPDNFTKFIKTLTGETQKAYVENTAHIEATSLKLQIATTNEGNAGTDDNIYAIVYRIEDNGKKTELIKKLLDKPYYNDFEAGDVDTYEVEIPEPTRVDRLEVAIKQETTYTAGSEWYCNYVKMVPMHAGVELTNVISFGGNHQMDSGKIWYLDVQKAIKVRENKTPEKQEVTNLKLEIKTRGSGSTPGTDSDIYVEAYNGDTLWHRPILDKVKNAYNDFEKGSTATYNVPVTKYNAITGKIEGITLDQLGIVIHHTGSDEWDCEEIIITPCNGDLALTNPISVGGKKWEDDKWHTNFGSKIKSSDYKKYSPFVLSYKTQLDDGLLSYINSIDGASQWSKAGNILWENTKIREKVFFEMFKGFEPDIKSVIPGTVEYNASFNMSVRFAGVWNGVRATRRNNVSDIPDMHEINGTATISFINSSGNVVSSTQKTLSSNGADFNNYTDPNLIPDTYDVKISYTADSSKPMYANMETTYKKALVVIGTVPSESQTIATAIIDDIKTPIFGKAPYEYAYSRTEHVEIGTVKWQIYDSDADEWNSMTKDDVFQKGERYRIKVSIKAKDDGADYKFPKKRNEMTVFINGKKAELLAAYNTAVCYAVLEFTPMEEPKFTVQPKGGQTTVGGRLNVTWETNFEPTRLAITIEGADRAIGLDKNQTSVDLAIAGENGYRLFAFYGDGEFIASDLFYITASKRVIKDFDVDTKESDVEKEIGLEEGIEEEPENAADVAPEVTEENKPADEEENKSGAEENKPTDEEKKPEAAEVPEISVENKFTDIKKTDWYFSDVLLAYQIGLINGKTATEYMPDNMLTYAEAIKLAACMHQLYTTGKVTLTNGNPWYQSYVDYCKENGIINQEYNYDDYATRAGYMTIFANALPDEALKAINNVPDNSIPDVPMNRNYSSSVYKLYRAGILQGSDAQHNCKPLENIKRSEVAAILSRMMYSGKRVAITDMGK